MGVDSQRALLAAACALAVLLAGASLAASDRGRVPGSDVDVAGSATGGTDADPAAGTVTPATGDATTPSRDTADSDASTATPQSAGTPPPDGSPTPTRTPTPTATPVPPDAGDGSAASPFVFPLVVMLVIGGFAAVGMWRYRIRAADADSWGSIGIAGLSLPIPGLGDDGSSPVSALAARATSATVRFPATAISLARASSGVASGAGSAVGSAVRAVSVAGHIQGQLLRSLASSGGSGGPLLPSLSGLIPDFGRDDRSDGSLWTGDTTDPSDVEEPTEPEIESIDDAWAELRGMVPARRRDTMTPTEIARLAIDEGFPRDPVVQLTDIFRETTYGGTPQTDDRRRAALDALRTIRDARGEE